MSAPTLRQWWVGFTFPQEKPVYPERCPGVTGYARQISEQLSRMPDEENLTPMEVVEWMADDLELWLPDGSPKKKGSEFTLEEVQALVFALSGYLAMLVQDFEADTHPQSVPYGFRESIRAMVRGLLTRRQEAA